MRVLVCGTNYGATYLRALYANESGLQLAGILARGERSRELAGQAGVPFYTRVDEVPRSIELACVAVSGEAGRTMTEELLARGIHVLAEHPRPLAEVVAHRQTARAHRAVYHVNAHYSDIEAAATFVTSFHGARQRSPLLFVNILTNPRALYSALELLGRAHGFLHELALERLPQSAGAFFSIARAGLVTIQMQNVVSEVDDGSANWVSHQITAGFEEGVLSLAEAQGPLWWMPAPPSLPRLASPAGPALWNGPLWRVLATPPATYGDLVTWGRDRANRIALARLVAEIRDGVTPREQSDQHLEGVSRLWEAMMRA